MQSTTNSQALNFSPEPANHRTLGYVFEEYLKVRRLKEGTIEDYKYRLELIDDWMNLPIQDITKEMVLARHAELKTNRGGRSADLAMTILSALVNWEQNYFAHGPVRLNPVRVLDAAQVKHGARSRIDEYLKEHEIGPWFAAVQELNNRTASDYLTCLLMTGMRRTECAQLEWKNVDLKARTILVQNTKNSRDLLLPLSDFMVDLLRQRRKHSRGKFVFQSRYKDVNYFYCPERILQKLQKETGIKVRLHALRRTFCWIAANSKVSGDEMAIRACLNEGPRKDYVWKHYLNVDGERIREMMNKVSNYVLERAEEVASKSDTA